MFINPTFQDLMFLKDTFRLRIVTTKDKVGIADAQHHIHNDIKQRMGLLRSEIYSTNDLVIERHGSFIFVCSVQSNLKSQAEEALLSDLASIFDAEVKRVD